MDNAAPSVLLLLMNPYHTTGQNLNLSYFHQETGQIFQLTKVAQHRPRCAPALSKPKSLNVLAA